MKVRLLVDGRSFDTEFQGTRTFIENIYNIIDKVGDIEIFLASENPEYTSGFFPGSRHIHFIKYRTGSKFTRVVNEIPAIISKHKINICHFQYVALPFTKTLQIVTIHDILFKDFPEDFGLKYKLVKGSSFYYSAKKADILTTVSEYSKKSISNHFNISLDKIHVIPNGVAALYFEPYDKLQAQKEVFERFAFKDYMLYVSRIEPRKNQIALLQSYLDLQLYKNAKSLVFVGKKSIEVPELDNILSSLSGEIKNRIFFLEDISNTDLRTIYKAADLFIYPSKAEGFGIPPLEAAALGIPTICSNTTAMADFTFFGENHIAPTTECLTLAISRAYGKKHVNLEQIQNVIRHNYDWEVSSLKLNEVIFREFR